MRVTSARLCLASLLVLAACKPDDPPKPPLPPEETPKLASVTVSCTASALVAGETTQCTASAKDEEGNDFTVASGYRWTTSSEAVARADTAGKVSTLSAGAVTITATATAEGVTKQGQASLTVAEKLTLHTTSITANETWRAADSPHVVRGQLTVDGEPAPTLTLEAGVEVRFEAEGELRITRGALKAPGTAQAPIRMTAPPSVSTQGAWRGVVFATAGSASELSHVTLSGCGGSAGEKACIALKNQAAPVLRELTLRDSGGAGITVADDGSAFGAGSSVLNVSRSAGPAVRIAANLADTLPAGGSCTDNTPNAIEIWGNVSRTQTWPNPGCPLVATTEMFIDGPTTPTLTLSAGIQLRFGRELGLYVSGENTGELVVNGTEAAPVVFTADSSSPTPGSWYGVFMGGRSSSNSRISHARIEYGGGNRTPAANLEISGNYDADVAQPVLDHVVLKESREHGVYLYGHGSFGPDSTDVTLINNRGYPISIEARSAGTLPLNLQFSGNVRDVVEIPDGPGVATSQTWRNIGVPYVISGQVIVGSGESPTLRLEEGVELRFGPDGGIVVGRFDPGNIRAFGGEQTPIRFIPDSPTPTKGSWYGVHVWQADNSYFDNTVITHGGRAGSFGGGTGNGNVNVYRNNGFMVGNSIISDSPGCAFTVSDGRQPGSSPVTRNYAHPGANNTLLNNDGGAQCNN